MIYIFDVDGTLTQSRNVIDPKFKTFFQAFIKKNRVWLISGSDKDKTIEHPRSVLPTPSQAPSTLIR